MSIYRSVRSIAGASGDAIVDWDAVRTAAKSATAPGRIDLTDADRAAYASDVRAARTAIEEAAAVTFDLPETIEVQHRHHWIDQNATTFQRVMRPLEARVQSSGAMSSAARIVNTGSMSLTLGFLARNVLGQYDPLLLAEQPAGDHGLYFVHPNIEAAAVELNVGFDRFRRWIAFHEVTHAAEFALAPWLPEYLTNRLTEGVDQLSTGTFDRGTFQELQTAMTAVEGYAELVMDAAFDDDPSDLRERLDARRQSAGPVSVLLRRVLGLNMKRRQYERGRAFFETVVDTRGLAAATAVWERPETLPRDAEFDHPERWLDRVDPR